MEQKPIVMDTATLSKDIQDKQNWIIPKGTEIYILAELTEPHTEKKVYCVMIDNGTGDKELNSTEK